MSISLPPTVTGKQRAAVECILEGDNFAFVRARLIVGIFTRQFQRRFIGFRPELQKNTLSAKVDSTSVFASCSTGSLV